MLKIQSIEEIEKETGIPKREIKKFSIHPDMSPKGKKHAIEQGDLTMMNNIWGLPILLQKAPYIRQYLENMRIEGLLSSVELFFVERYARSRKFPFQRKRSIYQYQIIELLREKKIREEILFKEIELLGLHGKRPPAA